MSPTCRRSILVTVASVLLAAGVSRGQTISAPPGGTLDAQQEFRRGVTALHNFEYEEANEAFLRAQSLQPAFAMPYWGEAMTYHQTLWRNEDVAAGRRALAKFGSDPVARQAKAATAIERRWLRAAAQLFGEGTPEVRRRAYADAMTEFYRDHSGDSDVAAFYALALLGTMSRSLIGTDSHEGHSSGLAGSAVQGQVAEILNGVLRVDPKHPGALHYLLHNYDDPSHAPLGLAAARTYAQVAPESSHALHMPAHIFLQLGMWADAERSDRAAFTASEAWVKRKALPPAMRSYHALSWRQYELLQLGRFDEAWKTLDEIAPEVKRTGDLRLLSDLSSMRARFVIETRRWSMLANERNFGNAFELCAIGMAAGRSGNASLAELARQALAARAVAPEEGELRPAIAIMERQVAATIASATGRSDAAVDILRAAAASELMLPPPLGLPAPIKPAPEHLGELLVELGRPAEAIEPFRQALRRNANRTLSQLGLARALTALGQLDLARDHYKQVAANYEHADAEVAEAAEARAALGPGSVAPGSRVAPQVAVASGVVLAVVVSGAWLWRAKRRARNPARLSSQRGGRRRRDRARR